MAHPSVIINGIVYQLVPSVQIPRSDSGTAEFFDASEANVSATDVRNGKVFIGASGQDTGSLADNGATGGTISTKNGSVTIPAGITSGGTVTIATSAVQDCQSQYILKNKSILGIGGSLEMPTISQNSTTKILSIS